MLCTELPQDFPAEIMKPLKITPISHAGILCSSRHLPPGHGDRGRGEGSGAALPSSLQHTHGILFSLVEDGLGAQRTSDTFIKHPLGHMGPVSIDRYPLFLNDTRIGILASPVN